MKIKCNYCNAIFNDTQETCPHCGAVNPGVVRTAAGEPTTIEALKKWYSDRGLPPYDTTRFYIGIDYKQPRAFGIYQDERTGNFVVYKNKDSGERAIRYEGTDEAYAVNELYQRLKQEIIQQKMNGVKNANVFNGSHGVKESGNLGKKFFSSGIMKFMMLMLLLTFGPFLLIIAVGIVLVIVTPPDGYYNYEGEYYYKLPSSYGDYDWVDDQSGEWVTISNDDIPKALKKKRSAKKCYLGEVYDSSWECLDFSDSIIFNDLEQGLYPSSGYYKNGDNCYYHITGDYDDNWYMYSDDWMAIDWVDLPYELQHTSTAVDFYYTPTWDSSTQYTDFEDSAVYSDWVDSHSSSDDSDSDDSDYDWDWGSDSWDSGSSDWDSDW